MTLPARILADIEAGIAESAPVKNYKLSAVGLEILLTKLHEPGIILRFSAVDIL